MSRGGDALVECCGRMHGIPAAILCIIFFCLQAAVLNYYLVEYLGSHHMAWLAGDIVILVLLVATIVFSARTLEKQRREEFAENYSIAWATWILMHSLLACKVIVIFTTFSTELDEQESFFGPNTLKTTIALGSVIFTLLLMTQHDAPVASERKKFIQELTGTVMFDLLDTTDILEILFDAESRESMGDASVAVILTVATVNLLIPTVPLITLSKTNFGHSRLNKNLEYAHKLAMVLIINVPNLLVRLVLWHGFSVGVSPFMLKNIILILMTLYEFYEHKHEKYEEHERERRHEIPSTNRDKSFTRMDSSGSVSIGSVDADVHQTRPSNGRHTGGDGSNNNNGTRRSRTVDGFTEPRMTML